MLQEQLRNIRSSQCILYNLAFNVSKRLLCVALASFARTAPVTAIGLLVQVWLFHSNFDIPVIKAKAREKRGSVESIIASKLQRDQILNQIG